MSIDPADLEVCLRVLAEADALPADDPGAVAIRRATAGLYKAVRKRRKVERRDAILAADRAVAVREHPRRDGDDAEPIGAERGEDRLDRGLALGGHRLTAPV